MIRPLRQRHRRIFAVLTVILPASFAIGIATRQSVPMSQSLPAALAPEVVFTSKIWARDDLFTKTPLRVVLLRDYENDGKFAVQLSAPAVFAKPDLLVYWTTNAVEAEDRIPDNAVLLGSFSGSAPLELPGEFLSMPGTLILYSLANGEVVEASKSISLR